jgi:hypothetical protein
MSSFNQKSSQIAKLVDHISSVYIIAHTESTSQLEEYLQLEGFSCHTFRQTQHPEFQTYSRSYLCLLNHRAAWDKIAVASQPSLVVEADFVPICHLGQHPLPFNPKATNTGIAWLYTCAPQLYTVTPDGYAEGFSTAAVAYILTPAAAQALLDLADQISRTYGPNRYSTWDSELEQFLRQRGFKNYIPFRNYGEHGGIPNPEHRHHGLSTTHRADTLYDRLAFPPLYAHTPLQFWQERTYARLKGLARLLSGRYLRPAVLQGSSVPRRLLTFALMRHIPLGGMLATHSGAFQLQMNQLR